MEWNITFFWDKFSERSLQIDGLCVKQWHIGSLKIVKALITFWMNSFLCTIAKNSWKMWHMSDWSKWVAGRCDIHSVKNVCVFLIRMFNFILFWNTFADIAPPVPTRPPRPGTQAPTAVPEQQRDGEYCVWNVGAPFSLSITGLSKVQLSDSVKVPYLEDTLQIQWSFILFRPFLIIEIDNCNP